MSSFYSSHRVRLFLGLALAISSSTGSSRAADEPRPALTLPIALQRAVELNPGLVAQGYAGRAAEALVEQAGLRPNPTLDVELENFAGTGRVRRIDSLEATVQASQTLERGGKRGKRVAFASRERDVANNELALQRTEVLAASAAAFVGVLAAQERLTLAADPLQLARDTVATVDARVKAAVASPAESARARAALASAQADFIRAEAGLASARAALAATWGGQPADVPSVTGSLHVPAVLPDESVLLAKLSAHPRLALQHAVVAGRRASLSLEQAQAAQDVTVGGGVRFLREGSDAAFVAGVSVPIPFHNKNQGNIRAAREHLAGAEQSVHAVEIGLRVAFTAAWQDLSVAHATALNLRRDALPATEEAYTTVRRAYEQGFLPLIDVLEAQRALVTLRRELLEAEAAYAVALARVEALTDASFANLTNLLNRS